MKLGSMLAGIAFTNPVAVSRASLSNRSDFHAPHVLSTALVLAQALRFNLP